MRLTVVGCAGSYPNASSPASCYLVEHDGAAIVLDLGNGALGALQQYRDPADDDFLAGVVLSHCHVDHCADVASLYVLRHYGPVAPGSPLPLLGPREARARIAQVYGMADPAPLDRVFAFGVLDGEPHRIGPFTVTAVPAAHPVESSCVRVEAGGRSITYSGDTGPTPALARLAQGTDIALFEATFVGSDNPPDLHMSGADAARLATEAGAGLLVLTHHAAWNDAAVVLAEARAAFAGPIEQARPGLTVSL